MIELIQTFSEKWREPFLWGLVQNTVFLGILFYILHRIRNTSANFKYWIAMIGYFKCLLPPFLPAYFFPNTNDGQLIFVTLDSSNITSVAQPAEPAFIFNTQEIFFILWSLAALIVLLTPVISTFRLHLKLRNASLYFINHKDKNAIPIYQSDKVSVPFSTGIIRPKIYVPQIWENWSSECRQMILKHEIAHIKRGDGFMRMIQNITHALYFFHPLIWVLNRKVHDYREMACDDSAVQKEKAVSIEYAKALVQIAENLVQSNIGCASASALIRQKHELLNRVKYQMEGTMKNLSKQKIGLILGLMILLIIPLSWSKSKAKENNKDYGTVVGRVIDAETGKALKWANIVLENTKLGTVADDKGKFQINDIPVGKYTIKANFIGYGAGIYKDVAIKANKKTKLNFKLESQVINMDIPPEAMNQMDNAPPPPFPADSDVEFAAYDVPPMPIGGFTAIQKNVVYPDIARRAGIEGKVLVYAQINEEGEVTKTKVVESLGNNGCDEAAVVAIRSVQWQPAKQRDEPVAVWVAVPVYFKLQAKEKDKPIVFVPFDEAPQPVGGFAALQSNVQYPDLARRAGIEGRVTVYVQISEEGEVLRTKVVQSLGNNGCDEAAVEAIKATKWTPAKKEGEPVAVWIAVPVDFGISEKPINTEVKKTNINITVTENKISLTSIKPQNDNYVLTGGEVELNKLKSELLKLMKQYDEPLISIRPGENPNMDLVEKVGAIVREIANSKSNSSSRQKIQINIDDHNNYFYERKKVSLKELDKKLNALTKNSNSKYYVDMNIANKAKMSAITDLYKVLGSNNLLAVNHQSETNESNPLMLPAKGMRPDEAKISQKNICELLINQNGELKLDQQPIQMSQIEKSVRQKYEENENIVISVIAHSEAPSEVFMKVLEALKKAETKRISVAEAYTPAN